MKFSDYNTKQNPYSLKKIVLQGSALSPRSWESTVSQELSRDSGIGVNYAGLLVPFEAATATRSDLAATGAANLGGATVEATLQTQPLPSLFANSICARLGAKQFFGLQGNFVFPYKS